MKAIQISMDEDLLTRLDADEEVQKDGRSAVLRRAVDQYLRQRRAQTIAAAYARAYGLTPGLDQEFAGWEAEGVWPEL